ncbi:hypothetical protein E4T56_gene2833 [Termitomyces sp. T112]|nr:hypothetical protein E4T56_gene2833 [Termitomyces sp. T112]
MTGAASQYLCIRFSRAPTESFDLKLSDSHVSKFTVFSETAAKRLLTITYGARAELTNRPTNSTGPVQYWVLLHNYVSTFIRWHGYYLNW